MKKAFWLRKWQDNHIGFHQNTVHPLLAKFIDGLSIDRGSRIFVPLCGKSLDLLYLNKLGYKVMGVELSELAVKQFFVENKLTYQVEKLGAFNIYSSDGITIYQGDFFDLTPDDCIGIAAVYDRAALIALPDQMVECYVSHLLALLKHKFLMLLITLDYGDTKRSNGPPFSTNLPTVKKLLEPYGSVERMYQVDILEQEPRFKSKGCEYLFESVYVISSHE